MASPRVPHLHPAEAAVQEHPAARTQPIARVPAINGLRLTAATGVLFVAYSYLVGLWPVRHGDTPAVVVAVREWFNIPLGIGEDFGVLGIGLLLFTAGYLAADQVAARRYLKLVGTVFARGYLPFAVAVTVSWLALVAHAEPLTDPRQVTPTSATFPASMLLVDRLVGEGALLALSWAVTAAALYLVLLAATAPLVSRMPVLATSAQLAATAAVTVTGSVTDGWYAELGQIAVFAVFPLLGALVQAARSRPSAWRVVPTGIGCLTLMIFAERAYEDLNGWWYPLTLVYVLLAGLLAVVLGERVSRTPVVGWLGTRAYPAALLVCAVGYPLIGALSDAGMPFWASLPLACVATLLAADAVHRLAKAVTP